jgi:lipopolysaccharide biosynthesis glycosyltransferase
MSLNDNYTYPIIVFLTSILIKKKKTTFINFHLIIDNNVKKENIYKISSLKKLSKDSKFIFHNVKNNFDGFIIKRFDMSVATFYRAIIGELIKDIDKIIYLDGDTLTYGDLTEMYNLDMTDLYFRGIREYRPNMKYTNVTRYICAGVMLMNLNLIRKNKVFEKFKEYYFYYANKGIYGNVIIVS